MKIPALIVALILSAAPAEAQNWSFDARRIGMGSVGSGNLALKMIEEESDYHAIVLPFGLFQVLRNIEVFQPDSERFDIVRSIEYAAAPLHLIAGRDSTSTNGREFVVDLRDATVSRDLNTYRGFAPATQPVAEGLAAPEWGGTIKVYLGARRAFHGVHVGIGPYLAMRSALAIDQRVHDILASDTNVYIPNAQFQLGNTTRGEAAAAVTVGYRGRLALPEGVATSERDGVYLAVNYNYLRGVRYENIDSTLRLDTDRTGLLTINPLAPSPLLVTRDHAASGRGLAIDVGGGVVFNRWEGVIAVRGLGNRIDWADVTRSRHTLGNIFVGDSTFTASAPQAMGDVRVTLPVDVQTFVGYRADRWSAAVEFGRGFQRTRTRLGVERRVGPIELRAGTSYARELWEPTAGVGLKVSRRVAFDVGLFGTAANVERKRKAALAFSLRFLKSS